MNISFIINFSFRDFVAICSVLVISGCAALPQQHKPVVPGDSKAINLDQSHSEENSNAVGWWNIGFHRDHKQDEEVEWQYDTLIALRIIKPVIDENSDIKLWRFHRRAMDDNSGHKFSYIFYSTRQLAEKVYQRVADHSLVKELIDKNHIERLSFYGINKKLRSSIDATSDRNWPAELQKSWPYFIMGVSQTWLQLVEHYYLELDLKDDAGLYDQLEGFRQVSESLDNVWKHYGNHAFLHHLNALFAYQELYILERRLGRF